MGLGEQALTMIDIVIPYVHTKDDWEIRYALRSIDENLKFDHRITFIGDQPEWAINVLRIHHTKRENIRQAPCYDSIEKMKLACDTELFSNNIIVWHDDQYLLRPLTKEYFGRTIAVCEYKDSRGKHLKKHGSGWQRNLYVPTMEYLRGGQDKVWNFETHLPRVYQRAVLRGLLEETNAQYHNYLYASLYYNILLNVMGKEPDNMLSEDKSILACFNGFESNYSTVAKTKEEVEQAVNNRLFLNHNDAGLSSALKEWIEKRFDKKSQYEL